MIYCVEDDENIRELIVYTLQNTGFTALGCNDIDELYEKLGDNIPELILLDIMLPKKDGLSILRVLKQAKRTQAIPVILLTAKGSEFEKVQGLDLGADDYITKPFGMMEMVSRIKAVLRRCSIGNKQETPKQMNELSIGDITLNKIQRSVHIHNLELALSFKEYELLQLFMESPNKVFTRDTLLQSVWGHEYYGESRTLDVHIRTLRQKLGDSAHLIKTVRNVGYKLSN